jgi:hypothetical protein
LHNRFLRQVHIHILYHRLLKAENIEGSGIFWIKLQLPVFSRCSQDNSVSTATGLQARWARRWGSIPSKGRRLFSSQ